MFPYIFAVFQLLLLIFVVLPFANSPLFAAGRANHASKVVMPFHLWVLVSSTLLFTFFYRVRREGVAEKGITVISFGATMFSALNLVFHIVDDLLLGMWITENITMTLYLAVPIIGLYKLSNEILWPYVNRVLKSKKH